MGWAGSLAATLALVVLTACGGGGSSAPTPAPTPTAAPAPPSAPNVLRLKAALAQGAALEVDPIPVTVTSGPVTSLQGGVAIVSTDRRIRMLGGRWLAGLFEGIQFLGPQTVTQSNPAAPLDQFTTDRYGLNTGFEFVLPAGQATFEFIGSESGNLSLLTLQIDGKATSETGYDLALTGTCCLRFVRVELPPSTAPRLITVGTPGMSFGGLRLPAGQDIGEPPDPANFASVVFAGDSIAEGAVSSSSLKSWIMQASIRLGIRNPINTGVGNTGYVAEAAGLSMPERIGDVLKAVNGAPPDMVVVAAGINDCGGFPHPQTAAAALAYFQALRAGAPAMPIVVLGPFNGANDTYPQILADCRDAIFAAARQVSGTYTVDVADWVSAANKDTVFGPGAPNGPHPTDAGHAIYGQRAAEAIRAIILALP